jgi:uncharacterized membrane protein YvbJ
MLFYGGVKMFCKYCGNELRDGSKFCNNCGREIKPKDNTSVSTIIGKTLYAFSTAASFALKLFRRKIFRLIAGLALILIAGLTIFLTLTHKDITIDNDLAIIATDGGIDYKVDNWSVKNNEIYIRLMISNQNKIPVTIPNSFSTYFKLQDCQTKKNCDLNKDDTDEYRNTIQDTLGESIVNVFSAQTTTEDDLVFNMDQSSHSFDLYIPTFDADQKINQNPKKLYAFELNVAY